MELSALESGNASNFTHLSQHSGVSLPSIKEFFQILEDTLIVKRLEPYLKGPRKRIFSRPKYYYFDIGVRNALAKLPLQSTLLKTQKGLLFEHFIILELIRRASLPKSNFRLYWWRTLDGAEVDCIIEKNDGTLIPLEIKATSSLRPAQVRGITSFLRRYPQAKIGYVASLVERPQKIHDNIILLPWQMI